MTPDDELGTLLGGTFPPAEEEEIVFDEDDEAGTSSTGNGGFISDGNGGFIEGEIFATVGNGLTNASDRLLHAISTSGVIPLEKVIDKVKTCHDKCKDKEKTRRTKCKILRKRVQLSLKKAGCRSKITPINRKRCK